MNVGDLVEYEGSHSYGKQSRDLGTVVRVDPESRPDDCYVIWHTADNEGWWSKGILKVVSKHESR